MTTLPGFSIFHRPNRENISIFLTGLGVFWRGNLHRSFGGPTLRQVLPVRNRLLVLGSNLTGVNIFSPLISQLMFDLTATWLRFGAKDDKDRWISHMTFGQLCQSKLSHEIGRLSKNSQIWLLHDHHLNFCFYWGSRVTIATLCVEKWPYCHHALLTVTAVSCSRLSFVYTVLYCMARAITIVTQNQLILPQDLHANIFCRGDWIWGFLYNERFKTNL